MRAFNHRCLMLHTSTAAEHAMQACLRQLLRLCAQVQQTEAAPCAALPACEVNPGQIASYLTSNFHLVQPLPQVKRRALLPGRCYMTCESGKPSGLVTTRYLLIILLPICKIACLLVLIWQSDLQTRLVKIVAKKELGIPLDELQQRLDTLLLLLPDLGMSSGRHIRWCCYVPACVCLAHVLSVTVSSLSTGLRDSPGQWSSNTMQQLTIS